MVSFLNASAGQRRQRFGQHMIPPFRHKILCFLADSTPILCFCRSIRMKKFFEPDCGKTREFHLFRIAPDGFGKKQKPGRFGPKNRPDRKAKAAKGDSAPAVSNGTETAGRAAGGLPYFSLTSARCAPLTRAPGASIAGDGAASEGRPSRPRHPAPLRPLCRDGAGRAETNAGASSSRQSRCVRRRGRGGADRERGQQATGRQAKATPRRRRQRKRARRGRWGSSRGSFRVTATAS